MKKIEEKRQRNTKGGKMVIWCTRCHRQIAPGGLTYTNGQIHPCAFRPSWWPW